MALIPRRFTWEPFQSTASADALLGRSVVFNGANAAALLGLNVTSNGANAAALHMGTLPKCRKSRCATRYECYL